MSPAEPERRTRGELGLSLRELFLLSPPGSGGGGGENFVAVFVLFGIRVFLPVGTVGTERWGNGCLWWREASSSPLPQPVCLRHSPPHPETNCPRYPLPFVGAEEVRERRTVKPTSARGGSADCPVVPAWGGNGMRSQREVCWRLNVGGARALWTPSCLRGRGAAREWGGGGEEEACQRPHRLRRQTRPRLAPLKSRLGRVSFFSASRCGPGSFAW